MNYMYDDKFGCLSIIVNMSIADYMSLIKDAYDNNGGITGQRSALTTKSAKKIREQMVDDFKQGAVLPAIVLGIVDSNYSIEDKTTTTEFLDYVKKINSSSISIIDGMQRTTAMKEASLSNEQQSSRQIRVEFWIVKNMNDLIYRMLILNTAQVPWNLRRQMEVVFGPMKQIIAEKIPHLNLVDIEDSQRRSIPGQFQSHRIIELFHVFSARSEKFDTKEVLSENYQRLDMIESMAKEDIFATFIDILKEVVDFDINISKCQNSNTQTENRFKEGKDIFTSQPALVGLVTILSQKIYGRPGNDYDIDRVINNKNDILNNFKSFNDRIKTKSAQEICDFLELEDLNERLSKMKGSKVGDYEREYFRSAFQVLIEEKFDIKSMSVCWRA